MARLNGTTMPQMPLAVANPLTASEVAKRFSEWLERRRAIWPDVPLAQQTKSDWVAPLEPRNPPVPAGTASNSVDRFIDAYLAANKFDRPESVSDAIFARRCVLSMSTLDFRPPSQQSAAARIRVPIPHKRGQLDRGLLLANGKRYKDHWISFWNDLLHNDIGVVYHGERKSITPWLEQALDKNMPYDAMIRELLNPVGPDAPDGFLVGVNWRGDVNASQTPFMQASQNTAQVFLGINLKCASCHDSFINRYKLRESYGLAAMFSEANKLELVRCDNKTGVFTEAQFLYPQLGEVPPGICRWRIAMQSPQRLVHRSSQWTHRAGRW